eukprot:gnl/Trimastix_PCT/1597.p1 GENE.gnl/Trimastix_PCT/1597~~gnl/Trimastix_PCT/1597.p1  ORF type:complete len:149 (+),score=18.50 gnl/Trimastix_PCT/1597:173-619(+)
MRHEAHGGPVKYMEELGITDGAEAQEPTSMRQIFDAYDIEKKGYLNEQEGIRFFADTLSIGFDFFWGMIRPLTTELVAVQSEVQQKVEMARHRLDPLAQQLFARYMNEDRRLTWDTFLRIDHDLPSIAKDPKTFEALIQPTPEGAPSP